MTFIELIAEIESRRIRGILFIDIINLSDDDILNFYKMGFKVSKTRNATGVETGATKIEWKTK